MLHARRHFLKRATKGTIKRGRPKRNFCLPNRQPRVEQQENDKRSMCQELPGTRLTTSSPNTVPRREPYLSSRRPPAFVATLPPMWQLPLAPRSRGMIKPRSSKYSLSFSRMQPAWHTRIPETQTSCYRLMLQRKVPPEEVGRVQAGRTTSSSKTFWSSIEAVRSLCLLQGIVPSFFNPRGLYYWFNIWSSVALGMQNTVMFSQPLPGIHFPSHHVLRTEILKAVCFLAFQTQTTRKLSPSFPSLFEWLSHTSFTTVVLHLLGFSSG